MRPYAGASGEEEVVVVGGVSEEESVSTSSAVGEERRWIRSIPAVMFPYWSFPPIFTWLGGVINREVIGTLRHGRGEITCNRQSACLYRCQKSKLCNN